MQHSDLLLLQVTKTTYVRWNGAYTEPLRQELCWHIVRILATGVCPKLADSTRTGMFLGKVSVCSGMLSCTLTFL